MGSKVISVVYNVTPVDDIEIGNLNGNYLGEYFSLFNLSVLMNIRYNRRRSF